MHYYFDVLKKYAVFEGRARRKEYWMFMLFNWIIIFVVLPLIFGLIAAFIYFAAGDGSTDTGDTLVGIILIFYLLVNMIYFLATFLPALAVMCRRLHDVGQSGWLILLSLVPLGGIVLFVFTCLDSQPWENPYGPNPKGINMVSAPPNQLL
ncbi:MAG: DUF805 domain-containing protein [Firmicutes bacterium]|nr:DUF805 domain-containing protein [Bacillota bacterium]